jgi:hypothetical protein
MPRARAGVTTVSRTGAVCLQHMQSPLARLDKELSDSASIRRILNLKLIAASCPGDGCGLIPEGAQRRQDTGADGDDEE